MQRITSESEIEEAMRDIGVGSEEKLRESEKRKQTLEKFAQLRSRNPKATVTLSPTETAFVKADDEEDGDFIDITITTKSFEQPSYELPEEYHHYLIQKGMVIHEAAHIMYSDYESFKSYIDRVEDEYDDTHAMMFKNIFNALEDGAIETFAQEDYRVEEELFHLRASLHENNYMGQEVVIGDETQYHYPFYFAVMAALMNIGVYDNGELRKLLDKDNDTHQIAFRGEEHDRKMLVETLPTCREYIEKIQSQRDAVKRADLIYELWDYLKNYINRSTTPGKKEMEREEDAMDGDSYAPGIPENIGEEHGGQAKKPIDTGDSGQNVGEKNALGDERKSTKEDIEENVADIKEKGKRGIIQETKEESGDWSEELEEIINSLGAGDGEDEIYIAEDGEVNANRKRKAENYGKRCAKIFRSRLRRVQKDKTVSGKKRGKFDTARLVQADRGSTKVFQKTQEGNDKNYSCMIVCDRSGSMGGRMEDVELAAGAVAYGLEEVGVDTSILDTYDSNTTLAKPFQSSVSNFTEKLFAGRIGGGTPLRHTVNFARKRIDRGKGDVPFMIIITDGGAFNTGKFKEEVKKANFPVLGLYLTESDVGGQLKVYDKAVTASSEDDVANELINLINSIVF